MTIPPSDSNNLLIASTRAGSALIHTFACRLKAETIEDMLFQTLCIRVGQVTGFKGQETHTASCCSHTAGILLRMATVVSDCSFMVYLGIHKSLT